METIETYWFALKRAKVEYEHKKREILVDYLMANNPHHEGDIIEDSLGKGRIITIRYGLNYLCKPECFYKVENLTKKGTVNKRDPIRQINQSNVYKSKTVTL